MGVAGPPAENRGGRILGTVREILRAGGGEVAVVDGPGGEPLVPLVRAFVPRFAPRRGVMVVDTRRLGLDDGAARTGPATDVRHARAARRRSLSPKAGRGRSRGSTGPVLAIDALTLFPALLEGPPAGSTPGRGRA